MSSNSNKGIVIRASIVIISLILLVKLFFLQVVNDKYAEEARRISRRIVTLYPDRGLIEDRNGKIIVFNDAAFDLMINFPFRTKNFDVQGFCALTELSREEFEAKLAEARANTYRGRAIFMKNLEPRLFARIQEGLHEFSHFNIETRTDRRYDYNAGGHVLGYVAEISRSELEKTEDGYYDIGEYVGKSGIEQFYEEPLRGVKGFEYHTVDHLGRIVDDYKDGVENTKAVNGKRLTSSLDIELQRYGEELMQNKIGSIVAIEPSSGEILAMVSSPAYDPNMFSIKNLGKYYRELARDKSKPLLNRAVAAQYPPGSVFKLIMALIGLEEGVITTSTQFSCSNGFRVGSLHVGCHAHAPRPDLKYSLITSCNAYYCNTLREILHQGNGETIEESYNNWRNYLLRFGLGSTLGLDVNQEKGGNVPSAEYYHRIHGHNRWNYLRIISLSIGQGELLFTPLQMANVAAIIANKGYYYVPHVVKAIDGKPGIPERFLERRETGISDYNFNIVRDAMREVYERGTAAGSQIKGITSCGKTGTVQNPHGENHSMFIAFAPKEEPKIAIAVVVENSGYGSTWAAPIASLMMEKYLMPDSTTQRPDLYERMIKGNLMPVDNE
ncbi:MAG: penicillin-binding protein 2 [Flavobacteriales bacterium]|nr:penicillin-binding protein 2 [Flavobacteriales bacterium]